MNDLLNGIVIVGLLGIVSVKYNLSIERTK